jgi:hypothetical protein
MTRNSVYLAPYWGRGSAWFQVRILACPSRGNVLVKWLTGPLQGREARLATRRLKPYA